MSDDLSDGFATALARLRELEASQVGDVSTVAVTLVLARTVREVLDQAHLLHRHGFADKALDLTTALSNQLTKLIQDLEQADV